MNAMDPAKGRRIQRFEVLLLAKYNLIRIQIFPHVCKGLDLVREMREKNLSLASATEMIDVSTASGEFNLTNLLNAAEFESKMIGKRSRTHWKKVNRRSSARPSTVRFQSVQWR